MKCVHAGVYFYTVINTAIIIPCFPLVYLHLKLLKYKYVHIMFNVMIFFI